MRQTRLRFTIAALLAVIAGILILVVADSVTSESLEWLRSLLMSVGGLLLASVALGLMWEYWGKASFLDEVVDRVDVAQKLARTGIRNVTNQYLHDVDWQELISSAKHVDLMFAYARTWRHTHRDQLMSLAHKQGCRVRVILPDTDDPETIEDLARRYSYDVGDLVHRIQEAKSFFADAHQESSGADVRVFMHASPQVYSYYRFDDAGVVTLYRQSSGRGLVPVIEFERGGVLYQMLKDDFEDVVREARQVYPHSGS